MKKKLSCVSLFLAIAMAPAVAGPQAEDSRDSSAQSVSQSEQHSTQQSLSSSASTLHTSQVLFRAKELIDRDVSTPQGHKVGKLQEIVFHPKIGVFGIVTLPNDRMAPIPWTLVSAVTPKALVVNTTMDSINSGPTISDKEWAQFNSPQFTQRIKSHYERQSETAQGGASLEEETTSGASSASDTNTPPSSIESTNSLSTVTNTLSLTDTNVPSLTDTNKPSADEK